MWLDLTVAKISADERDGGVGGVSMINARMTWPCVCLLEFQGRIFLLEGTYTAAMEGGKGIQMKAISYTDSTSVLCNSVILPAT